jgi:hypothetical protein
VAQFSPRVFKPGAKAMAFLRARVAKGTILNADESPHGKNCTSVTRPAGSITSEPNQ